MADNWGVDASPNSLYFFANNYMDGLTRIMHNGYGLGLTLAGQKDFDAKRDLFILESFISNKSNVDQREFAKMEESVKKKERLLKMYETHRGTDFSRHRLYIFPALFCREYTWVSHWKN